MLSLAVLGLGQRATTLLGQTGFATNLRTAHHQKQRQPDVCKKHLGIHQECRQRRDSLVYLVIVDVRARLFRLPAGLRRTNRVIDHRHDCGDDGQERADH